MTVLHSKLKMFEIMCSYLLHNLFWKTRKPGSVDDSIKRSKTGNSLRGEKKNYATPTNEELGQTSNWSKLVAAYLPVARLTILDRLVLSFCVALFYFINFDTENRVYTDINKYNKILGKINDEMRKTNSENKYLFAYLFIYLSFYLFIYLLIYLQF